MVSLADPRILLQGSEMGAQGTTFDCGEGSTQNSKEKHRKRLAILCSLTVVVGAAFGTLCYFMLEAPTTAHAMADSTVSLDLGCLRKHLRAHKVLDMAADCEVKNRGILGKAMAKLAVNTGVMQPKQLSPAQHAPRTLPQPVVPTVAVPIIADITPAQQKAFDEALGFGKKVIEVPVEEAALDSLKAQALELKQDLKKLGKVEAGVKILSGREEEMARAKVATVVKAELAHLKSLIVKLRLPKAQASAMLADVIEMAHEKETKDKDLTKMSLDSLEQEIARLEVETIVEKEIQEMRSWIEEMEEPQAQNSKNFGFLKGMVWAMGMCGTMLSFARKRLTRKSVGAFDATREVQHSEENVSGSDFSPSSRSIWIFDKEASMPAMSRSRPITAMQAKTDSTRSGRPRMVATLDPEGVEIQSRSHIQIPNSPAALINASSGTIPSHQTAAPSHEIASDEIVSQEKEMPVWAWRGLILMLTMMWASNYPCIKAAFDTMPDLLPSQYSALRFSVAGLVLTPWLVQGSAGALTGGAEIGCWLVMGYFGQAIGLATTTANKSAFICALHVLMVAGVMGFAEKRFENRTMLAALMAVAGVGMLELQGATAPVVGDLWCLAQPIGFGMGYIKLSQLMKKHPEEVLPISAAKMAVVGLASIAWVAAQGQTDPVALVESISANPGMMANLFWTGAISSALAIVIEATAFKHVPATDAAVILASEPLWTAIIAAVFLREQFGLPDMLGGALLLSGCLLNEVKKDSLPALLQGGITLGASEEDGLAEDGDVLKTVDVPAVVSVPVSIPVDLEVGAHINKTTEPVPLATR